MEKGMHYIVKGLPFPMDNRSGSRRYPFLEMDFGDCLRFEASSRHDPAYVRVYASAVYYSKRSKGEFAFRFARIDGVSFGCWKIRGLNFGGEVRSGSGKRGEPKARRVRRGKKEIESIPADAVRAAWESEGTVSGAARRLGIHPPTCERLMRRLSII